MADWILICLSSYNEDIWDALVFYHDTNSTMIYYKKIPETCGLKYTEFLKQHLINGWMEKTNRAEVADVVKEREKRVSLF